VVTFDVAGSRLRRSPELGFAACGGSPEMVAAPASPARDGNGPLTRPEIGPLRGP